MTVLSIGTGNIASGAGSLNSGNEGGVPGVIKTKLASNCNMVNELSEEWMSILLGAFLCVGAVSQILVFELWPCRTKS